MAVARAAALAALALASGVALGGAVAVGADGGALRTRAQKATGGAKGPTPREEVEKEEKEARKKGSVAKRSKKTKKTKKETIQKASPNKTPGKRGTNRRGRGRIQEEKVRKEGEGVCVGTPQSGARRVVSVADVHGDFEGMLKLLQALNLVSPAATREYWPKELWVGGNTHFIQLGDVVDTGEDGRAMYLFLWTLQDDARRTHGTVDLLAGNHELLLLQGNLDSLAMRRHASSTESFKVLGHSRRVKALCSYVSRPAECVLRAAEGNYACAGEDVGVKRAPEECVRRAWDKEGAMGSKARERLKVAVQVGDSAFVHAGLLPGLWARIGYTGDDPIGRLNQYFNALVNGATLEQLAATEDVTVSGWDENNPLWTRAFNDLDSQEPGAFSDGRCELVKKGLEFLFGTAGGKRMVIGHNQVMAGMPVAVCQGHLIMTDTVMSRGFLQMDIPTPQVQQQAVELFDPRLSALETFDTVGAEVWSVQPVGSKVMQGKRCARQ